MEETMNQPGAPADSTGAQDGQGASGVKEETRPREPELDAFVDAAVVLLSGWATLGLRVSKLVLREGARTLEHGARVLQSLAMVIERKLENPRESGPSGT
jgi:hypothetical protein